MGAEVVLSDPDTGDFRPREGSAAVAYGCQTFSEGKLAGGLMESAAPVVGQLIEGAEIEVGGLITENTTWDAGVVRVVASVEVARDACLTIAAGTRVEFAGDFRLLVQGQLWAVGAPDARIVFTAAAEQQASGWDGIEFLNIPAANGVSRLEHCDISYAVAKSAGDDGGTTRPGAGGAVSIVGVNHLEIAACVFSYNSAEYGGAVYCGYGASPVLAGNLFHNNTATWKGSALFNVYAYPKLINNTIADNTCLAESSFHPCGAVDNFNGKIVMVGNIIRGNFTNHYSGMQVLAAKDYYAIGNNIEAYVGNDSNVDLDAGFLGSGAYPYQLDESSRCIDSGVDHSLVKALADTDIAGLERVCDGVIDMGAFEYCGAVSGVPEAAPAGLEPALSCAPNPFNPRTTIVFELSVANEVELRVFDLQGRLVLTLLDDHKTAGRHNIVWNGRDAEEKAVASGIYLYQLRAGDHHVTRRMTLLR